MSRFKYRFLALIVAAMAIPAYAAIENDALFSWTPPTTRDNGDGTTSPLDPNTEIASYEFECASDETFVAPLPLFVVSNQPSLTQATILNAFPAAGWWYCRGRAVDTEGQQAEWSDVASAQIKGPPSKMPVFEFDFQRRQTP